MQNCKHQVYIHVAQGETLDTRITLAKFVELFRGDDWFLICHRGVLVNLAHGRILTEICSA